MQLNGGGGEGEVAGSMKIDRKFMFVKNLSKMGKWTEVSRF